MYVRDDEALREFRAVDEETEWMGTRLKRVRAQPITPGGRTTVTLFEEVEGDGRPHPRMQFRMPPATDPDPRELAEAPTADQLGDIEGWIAAIFEEHAEYLAADDLDSLPDDSPRFFHNSVRTQRISRVVAELGTHLDRMESQGTLTGDAADAARFALARRRDLAFSGRIDFDDEDTGTYHSFKGDAPFVHYLEALLEALPPETSEAFATQPPEQQQALRKQRVQILAHLDHLMRHKYAHDGVHETDIERSVGGRLIDRDTRNVVSETPESAGDLLPRHELLRVDPASDRADAGAWLYRDGDDLKHRDGTTADVPQDAIRRIPIEPGRLTFERAPDSDQLRSGVRMDWNGSGYVESQPIGWIGWAGHCDIKAIEEQLGVTLMDQPSVTEFRSDTAQQTRYTRDLLLEMLTSALELGSVYRRADGSGRLMRGQHHFGGFRNDSRPDRLQFAGPEPGRGFRWPLAQRREVFTVTRIDAPGRDIPLRHAFLKAIPDTDAIDFEDNPRFRTTVEGDYNVIDVADCVIKATTRIDVIDPKTGYLDHTTERTEIDLRRDALPADGRRDLLGTHVDDPAGRRIFRVYLEQKPGQPAEIVAELDVYEKGEDGTWTARVDPDSEVRMTMADPLVPTLSREIKHDDPTMYDALLQAALHRGENICADTDEASEVWNGVVTRIEVSPAGTNPDRRTERWHIDLKARFGKARLDILQRRDARGSIVATCPVPPTAPHDTGWPDFLWQDFPDVGSKGMQGADWIVNESMWERGVVEVRRDPTVGGGIYVHDEHIKSVFEILYAGLAGYPWTVVHENKRYGFTDEAAWTRAVDELTKLRAALSFEQAAGVS